MTKFAIETVGLTKVYQTKGSTFHAVDGVDLRVQRGEIYGFLGLNGAGKTTTIRTLLGMIRPTAGTVRVLGEPVGPFGKGPWGQVGHLVEAPAVYPELTTRENLEIARRLQRVTEKQATTTVMEQLGIERYCGPQSRYALHG